MRLGKVRINAYRTSHLDETRALFAAKHPEVGFDAFSLVAEADGKRIGYSGDMGRPQDLHALLKRPVEVLVIELAHCAVGQLLDFLRLQQVRHVVFTHLSRSIRADRRAVRLRATSALRPRRVTFAVDGDTIEF